MMGTVAPTQTQWVPRYTVLGHTILGTVASHPTHCARTCHAGHCGPHPDTLCQDTPCQDTPYPAPWAPCQDTLHQATPHWALWALCTEHPTLSTVAPTTGHRAVPARHWALCTTPCTPATVHLLPGTPRIPCAPMFLCWNLGKVPLKEPRHVGQQQGKASGWDAAGAGAGPSPARAAVPIPLVLAKVMVPFRQLFGGGQAVASSWSRV